jgi:hypothetical protein
MAAAATASSRLAGLERLITLFWTFPESLGLARRQKTFSLHRSKYLVALDLIAARLGWRMVPHVAAFQTFPRPAT